MLRAYPVEIESACTPPQVFHYHGPQREHAQRHQRGDELRRDRGMQMKLPPAVRTPRSDTGMIGGLLRGDDAVETGAEEGEDECRRNDAERGRGGKCCKP